MKRNAVQIFLLGLISISQAWASGTGGSGLPWETPINLVAKSLTGPVALSISIMALFAAGGTLIFGGELGEFTRRASVAVIAISIVVGGASIMSILYGMSGALV